MDRIVGNPYAVALFSAHFMPYMLVVFGVVGVRAAFRKMRGGELLLLLLVGLFFAVEGVQMRLAGPDAAQEGTILALNRYFGVFSPLLWIFAAKGVAALWWCSKSFVRWVVRCFVVLCLFWVFFGANVGMVLSYQTGGTAYDTAVAVHQIAPVIRQDYKGPARREGFRQSPLEYYTGKRPLVVCPYAAAGWAVRGDSCGVTGVKCPYPEDYLFYPVGSDFAGITNVDERVYEPVAIVRGGSGADWMLYRRRVP